LVDLEVRKIFPWLDFLPLLAGVASLDFLFLLRAFPAPHFKNQGNTGDGVFDMQFLTLLLHSLFPYVLSIHLFIPPWKTDRTVDFMGHVLD